MLAKIIIENGVKKLVPLTADAGAGNPVGTIIPMYKKSSPSGYLYCDGSTFDANTYPLLYAYLGTNVLPDYREFALVGAEENTTDVYNASTNPNGTIHDHDVYTEGQAKDDQLQRHNHKQTIRDAQPLVAYSTQGTTNGYRSAGESFVGVELFTYENTGRSGTVTRGKRKAVYFYIKATSGISENAQDNVINTLNEQRSYSTSEVNTGKKWIDGKPIYRKVMPILSTVVHDEWSLAGYQSASALFGSNVETLVNTLVIGSLFMPTIADKTQGLFTRGFNVDTGNIILEYTKTN